jgi:hypothetical protein
MTADDYRRELEDRRQAVVRLAEYTATTPDRDNDVIHSGIQALQLGLWPLVERASAAGYIPHDIEISSDGPPLQRFRRMVESMTEAGYPLAAFGIIASGSTVASDGSVVYQIKQDAVLGCLEHTIKALDVLLGNVRNPACRAGFTKSEICAELRLGSSWGKRKGTGPTPGGSTFDDMRKAAHVKSKGKAPYNAAELRAFAEARPKYAPKLLKMAAECD